MSRFREIDTGIPMTRFARGWHCLGLAETFRAGGPHGVDAFGVRLNVCAAEGGALTVQAPGSQCWPTCEVNEQLLVWHDPEGTVPPPDSVPPAIDGFVDGHWSPWQWNSILIEGSHCREIIDNIADMAHFFYIHHAYPTYFKNVISGQCASQFMESRPRPDRAGAEKLWEGTYLRSEATYFGPSYMINWLHNDLGPGFTAEIVLINCHYPVTHDSFVLQWAVSVQQLPALPPEKAGRFAAALSRSFGQGFLEDIEIWKYKARVDNPLLTEEDGPVYQLRRWYEQFYVDAADVTEEMTNRFEVEVDSTQALPRWEEEVAANLAAGVTVT